KNALLKVRLIKRNNATSSDWSQDIGGKLACPTRLKTELRGLPDCAIRQAGSSETTFGRKHGPCPQGIPLLGYGRTNADKLEGIRHRITQSHGDLFRVRKSDQLLRQRIEVTTSSTLKNLRFAYASTAIRLDAGQILNLLDSQFVQCNYALNGNEINDTFNLENDLFYNLNFMFTTGYRTNTVN